MNMVFTNYGALKSSYTTVIDLIDQLLFHPDVSFQNKLALKSLRCECMSLYLMNSWFLKNLGIVEPITLFNLVTAIVNHLGHESIISTFSAANKIMVTNTLPELELQHKHVAPIDPIITDNAGFNVTNDIATIKEVDAVTYDTEIANVIVVVTNDADTYENVIDNFRNKKVSSYHSDDKFSEVTKVTNFRSKRNLIFNQSCV